MPPGADMNPSSRWHQQLTHSLTSSFFVLTSAPSWRKNLLKEGGLNFTMFGFSHHYRSSSVLQGQNDRRLLSPVGKAAWWWKCKPAGDRNRWNFCVCSHQLLTVLPAADPAHQQRVVDGKLDDRVQLLGPLVQQVVQLGEQPGRRRSDVGRTNKIKARFMTTTLDLSAIFSYLS